MSDKTMTYEESVQWVRSQPELHEVVKLCYLDKDVFAAAERFQSSEEFTELASILKLSALQSSPRKILDLGCGNGIVSYAFASLGHDVSAVDPDLSDDVGLKATERLAATLKQGSIRTFQAYAEDLPFENGAFDVIYTRQAVHHFGDLDKGFAECARVLRPGGLFFATREHVVNDQKQLEQFLEEHLLHKLHGGENAYPLARYLSALNDAGLEVVKCYAAYDTVINHFPTSNGDIKQASIERARRRLGNLAGTLIGSTPQGIGSYRRKMSSLHNVPGRMYSFLCKLKL